MRIKGVQRRQNNFPKVQDSCQVCLVVISLQYTQDCFSEHTWDIWDYNPGENKNPRLERGKIGKMHHVGSENKNYKFFLPEKISRTASQHKSLITWPTSRRARLHSRPSVSQLHIFTFALYNLPLPVLPNTHTLIKHLITQNCHRSFSKHSSRWTKWAAWQNTGVLIPSATLMIRFDRLYVEMIDCLVTGSC